jgi:hypothetical protein
MTSEPVAILEADDNEAVVAIANITAASVGAYGVPARVSVPPSWHPTKPTHTKWYCNYVQIPRVDSEQWLMKFRHRFGVHYAKYLEAVEDVKADGNFKEWMKPDMADIAPIELLVLGALSVLGRAGCWCDGLSESTLISKTHHRAFNEAFNEFVATTLYDEHVKHRLTKKRKLELEHDNAERIELVRKYFARKPK